VDRNQTPAGYNIGINDGSAAGQNLFLHLNVHLIPRFTGDCRDPRGGVRWVIPQKADYWSLR
jgi:diadenosine tetraphosphate (Ap4A) HIT family hydrolase